MILFTGNLVTESRLDQKIIQYYIILEKNLSNSDVNELMKIYIQHNGLLTILEIIEIF